MNRKKFSALVLICVFMSAFMVTGCSSKSAAGETDETSTEIVAASATDADAGTETEEQTTEAPVEEEDVLKTIGKETSASEKIKLKNATGNDIILFEVRKGEDGEYLNLLDEDDIYAADEERYLYYETDDTAGDESKEYEVRITFADDAVAVLHDFPFDDMEEGEIRIEDDIAYLKYFSRETQKTVETKEAETAIGERQEETVTKPQSQTEQPRTEQPQTEQPQTEQPQTEQPQTEQDWGGDNGCLDGDALFY